MEVTTFQGHANAFGVGAPVDFRVGSAAVPDWNALLGRLAAQRTLVSINHPALPSGEICMGCGWTPQPAADLAKVQAVEAVNGADADTPISGLAFWHARLNEGHRLTGVGGSDNHDPTLRIARIGASRIGAPTTVVHARELSQPAILDALRAGRAFIDVQGTRERSLEFDARADGREAKMGDILGLPGGAEAEFAIDVGRVPGGRVQVIVDGKAVELLDDATIGGDAAHLAFHWRSDGARHWLRIDVRDTEGKLALVGNPIYVNFARPGAATRNDRNM